MRITSGTCFRSITGPVGQVIFASWPATTSAMNLDDRVFPALNSLETRFGVCPMVESELTHRSFDTTPSSNLGLSG